MPPSSASSPRCKASRAAFRFRTIVDLDHVRFVLPMTQHVDAAAETALVEQVADHNRQARTLPTMNKGAGGPLQIRVLADDHRVFPTELERAGDQLPSARFGHLPPRAP